MADTVRFVPTQAFGLIAYGELSNTNTTISILVPIGAKLVFYSLTATFEAVAGADPTQVSRISVKDGNTTLLAVSVGRPTLTASVAAISYGTPGLEILDNVSTVPSPADKTISIVIEDYYDNAGTWTKAASVASVVNVLVSYQLVPTE